MTLSGNACTYERLSDSYKPILANLTRKTSQLENLDREISLMIHRHPFSRMIIDVADILKVLLRKNDT